MNRLVISAKPKRLFSVIAAILALTLAATSAPSTVGTADSQRYLDDIKALTTPAMEGRGDGTKGLTRAAHLIEKRFASLGLKPAGTHSYLQSFTVITGARLKSNNHFTVHRADSKTDLKVNQDFVPLSFSASGSADAPVVFAGYGASADEFQYAEAFLAGSFTSATPPSGWQARATGFSSTRRCLMAWPLLREMT